MEAVTRSLLPRLAYGALFVVLLPLALFSWARAASEAVNLPAVHVPAIGLVVAAAGVIALLVGIAALWRRGGGMPMNAFPPPRYVDSGIYSLVPHPVYGGFTLICAGLAMHFGSASGLWLVSSAVALGCSALVLGYELPDLRSRFGAPRFSVWLPRGGLGVPSFLERFRIYPVVILPWLACFELIGLLGRPAHATSSYMSFESRLPVLEWTGPIYASTYLVVLAAPLLASSRDALRRFAKRSLRAMAIMFPLYLVLPFDVPPRPFHASTFAGRMLLWEHSPLAGSGAMPSFHVVWAFIAASALAGQRRSKKILWWSWAVFVAISCIATGMHSIADVLAGAAAFAVVVCLKDIWKGILWVAERIANSWKEWLIGPVRIINHGAFAAAAAIVGMLILGSMTGHGGAGLCLCIFSGCIAGAVLWAQYVEGSPSLLRPMGFYGGLIGAVVGAATAPLFSASFFGTLAALAVAGPWIQALGRLRCLVQGCCHGRPTTTVAGICYTHPRSRVSRLTPFAGIPVHATPVYSILYNAVSGIALLRLLQSHVSSAMICGIYLLLSGMGRFVEEAYRGEPQTKTAGGLRLYQWIAIGTVVLGAGLTCVKGSPQPVATPLHADSLITALICGALTWLVSGVDLPEATGRFARLT